MRASITLAFGIRIFLLLSVLSQQVYSQRPRATLGPGTGAPNKHVSFHFTSGTTKILSPDTTYLLTGWTFVDSLATIVIPAGTVIRGDKSSMGALIIKRGGKIIAEGTAENPIVFTSDLPQGSRAPGDWGGVIICGAAPINRADTANAEGGFGTVGINPALYGGSYPDDSSGILKYVRIEFAGDNTLMENEVNALTFAGVGRKTVINFVQVSFANDDDFQFFGGTVDAKHLISWRCRDDNFDTEYGYDGRLQFLYAKRDPSVTVESFFESSNGIESDSDPNNPLHSALPKTKARISNLTLIGPAQDTNISKTLNPINWQFTSVLRSGSELSIYNSVLMGFDNGIVLWDSSNQASAQSGNLQIRNTSLQSRQKQIILASAAISGFNAINWFSTGTGNLGSSPRNVSDIGLSANAFQLNTSNDPVPPTGSEPDVASTAFDGRLFGDSWFDNSAAYRGAFEPGIPMSQQWSAGWSNFDPQNYNPESVQLNIAYSAGWNLVSPPLANTDLRKVSVFPNALGSVFAFENGSYIPKDTLVKGTGYWAYYNAADTEEIFGVGFDSTSFSASNVPAGGRWFLIGTISQNLPLSSLYSIPSSGIDRGSVAVFGFSGSYITPTTLQPGRGYWLYVFEPCTIVVAQ